MEDRVGKTRASLYHCSSHGLTVARRKEQRKSSVQIYLPEYQRNRDKVVKTNTVKD
jgi:hypothetical protein